MPTNLLPGSWLGALGELERDPRNHNNIKRLAGKYLGLSRYRVGDWRVIYRIDDKAKQVLVLSVANRREAY